MPEGGRAGAPTPGAWASARGWMSFADRRLGRFRGGPSDQGPRRLRPADRPTRGRPRLDGGTHGGRPQPGRQPRGRRQRGGSAEVASGRAGRGPTVRRIRRAPGETPGYRPRTGPPAGPPVTAWPRVVAGLPAPVGIGDTGAPTGSAKHRQPAATGGGGPEGPIAVAVPRRARQNARVIPSASETSAAPTAFPPGPGRPKQPPGVRLQHVAPALSGDRHGSPSPTDGRTAVGDRFGSCGAWWGDRGRRRGVGRSARDRRRVRASRATRGAGWRGSRRGRRC